MQKIDSPFVSHILSFLATLAAVLLLWCLANPDKNNLWIAASAGFFMIPVFRQDFKGKRNYLAAVLVSGFLVPVIVYAVMSVI